jgi:hypothetical protein
MPNSVRTHTNTYSKKGIKSRCDLGASGIMDIVENIDQGPMLKKLFMAVIYNFS